MILWWRRRRGLGLFFFVFVAEGVLRLADDLGTLLGDDLFALREFLLSLASLLTSNSRPSKATHPVETGNALQPRSVLILVRPATEQLRAFLPHIRIRQIGSTTYPESLQQRLIRERPLEPRACVLDEAVEEDKRSQLAVHAAVLQLLADGTSRFGRA